MPIKTSTSVNILRDFNREINYIPTPNSYKVVDQISKDFKQGHRSFNIIGSFGTGKSSFLWAYHQSLLGKKKIFKPDLINNPTVSIVSFIGEYKSIIEAFAEEFDAAGKEVNSILSSVYNHYHDLGKSRSLLVIVIDEFGKFLEYASQNSPEKELYFIQQLTEFANNHDHNILLLTTVHQNFDAYGYDLTISQKQEWTKIRGRFKEVAFNEPVEQLLYLASEHISKLSFNSDPKTLKAAVSIALGTKAFETKPAYIDEIAVKLYPLDVLSAISITKSLQRYGQNERSLFSFLEASDYTGINSNEWAKNNPFFNVSCVYDYTVYNLYSFINSRFNPDYSAWASIKNTLEEVERVFDKETSAYRKIIKTVGLLNIIAVGGSILDKTFLISYSRICLGIDNAEKYIDELEKRKLIHFRKYSNRYIIFEGTDLDIESALNSAEDKVSEIQDVSTLLNKYFQLPLVLAKRYSFQNGTPRFFEYIISDYPITKTPVGEIDGFINLVFNEKLYSDEVVRHSLDQPEAILYGFYNTSKDVKKLLFEIEKTKQVITEQEIVNDKIALRELNNILEHQQNLLNHKILNSFYSIRNEISWIYNGNIEYLHSKKQFNNLLSTICNVAYPESPRFNNELVNKHKISASIHTAKRNYFKALVNNWDKPQLGFPKDKYPPEKTIYLSLFESNGISLYTDDVNSAISVNESNNFHFLWQHSNNYLNSARLNRKRISDFVKSLSVRPLKLKQGLIDFWIPSFLFIKRDDFALFGENGYIPTITDEILELVIKYPDDYEIKTFAVEGVKLDIFNSYRLLLQQDTKNKLSNNNFIETIKPFVTFYHQLPEYSRKTKRLNPEALQVRNAITKAVDPEKTFFDDFPAALGFSEERLASSQLELQKYISKLQEAIRELRSCYDNLTFRMEEFIRMKLLAIDKHFQHISIVYKRDIKH